MSNDTDLSLSDATDPMGRSPLLIRFQLFCAVLILLLALTGNCLVVWIIHGNPRFRTTTNIFITNLALSDILMALFQMPFWIVSVAKGRWVLNESSCYVAQATQFTFGIASVHTHTLIALNRYFKTVKTKHYSLLFSGNGVTKGLIVLSWLIPFMFSTPPSYGWGNAVYYPHSYICTIEWDLKHISYIVVVLGISITPAMNVTFFCYLMIYREVRRVAARLKAHAHANKFKRDEARRRIHDRTESALLRTTFIVLCVFVVCWTPAAAIGICEIGRIYVPFWIRTAAIYMLFAGSCLNPLIYGLLNPQFKRAFRDLYKCRKPDSHESTDNQTGMLTLNIRSRPVSPALSRSPRAAFQVSPHIT